MNDVDEMITKATGREFIDWTRFSHLVNKLLLLIVLITVMWRPDFATLAVCTSILIVERAWLSKSLCRKQGIALLGTAALDLFWLIYYLLVVF